MPNTEHHGKLDVSKISKENREAHRRIRTQLEWLKRNMSKTQVQMDQLEAEFEQLEKSDSGQNS